MVFAFNTGPRQQWLVGNLLQWASDGDHQFLHKTHKRYGNVYKVIFAAASCWLFASAQMAHSLAS